MSMRRAPIPDGALLSPSWSSSFSFEHGIHQMLESPMPSPALPSIVPRHGKKPRPNYVRKALRWLLPIGKWVCGILVIVWVLKSSISSRSLRSKADDKMIQNQYHLVDENISLQEPSPILIADSNGGVKFSVSLPSRLKYPLKPSEYRTICSRSDDTARRLRHETSPMVFYHSRGVQDYYYIDTNFMDVKDAAEHGLLPITNTTGSQQVLEKQDSKVVDRASNIPLSNSNICEKSLTYVLEGSDAGIGRTLMGLWLAYGLAKEEGRAFFVDDSNWSYGRYTDLFKPPPLPSCLPAPANHRLPCPHQARHLLISSSTSKWAFGVAFRKHFEDHARAKVHPQEKIFALLRIGYETLFKLLPQDAAYVEIRLAELSILRLAGKRVIGLHVRRGNRHPWEPQYQDSYTPLESYMNAANMFNRNDFQFDGADRSIVAQLPAAGKEALLLLASDDPDMYNAPELINTQRAQSHISLANKAALDAASPKTDPANPGSEVNFIKFVEGNVGWEAGFFPSVFWGLGDSAAGSAAARGLREEREDPRPSELTLSLRRLVARSYLLDLQIVGSSDAVVCGVSSAGCRLLAVMLGWQKAIIEGGWKNVDGRYGWTAFGEDGVP